MNIYYKMGAQAAMQVLGFEKTAIEKKRIFERIINSNASPDRVNKFTGRMAKKRDAAKTKKMKDKYETAVNAGSLRHEMATGY